MAADSSPTSVYKFFDAQGALLYVGVTSQGPGRFYQHNRQKEWWPEVASTQIEHYPTREQALEREKELIRIEHPRENIQHLPGASARRTLLARPLAESRTKKAA